MTRRTLFRWARMGAAALPLTGSSQAQAPPAQAADELPEAQRKKKLKVVFVGAHVDDWVDCAGTLARYTRLGHEALCISFTPGDSQSMADQRHMPVEKLAALRREHADKGAKILGARMLYLNQHNQRSSISRPEHLTLFELGIAKKLDFAFAGPQSLRVAQLLEDGVLEIGAIHTYVELYARLLVDLAPNVVLVCAEQADREGNLYTGPNTEDTPVIVEAAAFHDGIVIAQVNEIVQKVPRVDIPSSWVDVVVEGDRPYAIEPLFTRDPRQITDLQILMAMMVIRSVYEHHEIHSLNHGIDSIPPRLSSCCRRMANRLDCAEKSASTGRSTPTRHLFPPLRVDG